MLESARILTYLFVVSSITPVFFRASNYVYNKLLIYHPKRSQVAEDSSHYETMTHAVVRVANLNFIISLMILNLVLLISIYNYIQLEFGLFIVSVAVVLNMSVRVSAISSFGFLSHDEMENHRQLVESGRILGVVFMNIIYFSIVLFTGFQVVSGAEISIVLSMYEIIYLVTGTVMISIVGAVLSELLLLAIGIPESILEPK